MSASETRIMLYILAQLRERFPTGLWERQNVVTARTKNRVVKANTPGSADIRGCWKGRYVELEVKTEDGVQSELQIERQSNVTRAGGVYAVVRSLGDALAVVSKL